MRGPGLARTYSMSIVGIEGHLVDVETYAGSGLVAFTLVGLLDTSVREARDRVRAAFESCGLDVLDQRITVNLSPAGIPKSGSAFDLSIAASIALATGLVSPVAFEDAVLVGELALDGSIQPVRGVLPAVLAARSRGVRRVVVPSACAQEARLVSGIEVLDFAHLADLIAWAGGDAVKAPFHGRMGIRRDEERDGDTTLADMADVRGQPEAIAAMEVAAAGGTTCFFWESPDPQDDARLPTADDTSRSRRRHRSCHHLVAFGGGPVAFLDIADDAASIPSPTPFGDHAGADRWRHAHARPRGSVAGAWRDPLSRRGRRVCALGP